MKSVDKPLLRNLLSRLNSTAFEYFVFELLRDGYGAKHFRKAPNLGSGVYIRDLPDYVVPPDKGEEWHYGVFEGAYIVHYIPLELLQNPRKANIKDPELVYRLKKIKNYYDTKPLGYLSPSGFVDPRFQSVYLLNNFSGFSMQEYIDVLIPKFEVLLGELNIQLKHVEVGNYDSFLENRPVETDRVFKNMIEKEKDGLCITLTESDVNVSHFDVEKQLLTGVSRNLKHPYEPVYKSRLETPDKILAEFKAMISTETRESVLEEFLTTHYTEIFGPQYDRIETQLWLRFPDLDINNRARRFDIFLRNSIANDWELFEVKRVINLTGSYRDVPVLTREVVYAVQQVRNYARILSQDKVKKHFEEEGIIYYEPSLNLILGRRPQIPISQWRWLVSSNTDVKLFTYDDLLEEMKLRQKDRLRFYDHM